MPATAPPVAPAGAPPYAVGESVMEGAVLQLQNGGFQVNAAVSRQANASSWEKMLGPCSRPS